MLARDLAALDDDVITAVLLTSRARLSGLESVRWTELDVLPGEDGVRLLERVVDDPRIAGNPDDAAAIVSRCGGQIWRPPTTAPTSAGFSTLARVGRNWGPTHTGFTRRSPGFMKRMNSADA